MMRIRFFLFRRRNIEVRTCFMPKFIFEIDVIGIMTFIMLLLSHSASLCENNILLIEQTL